jgi:DNA-binding IclR family transcriptional regulator
VEESQETVHLGVLEGGEVVVMDTMESPQAVRMSCKIGSRAPLHATAIGKILLWDCQIRKCCA